MYTIVQKRVLNPAVTLLEVEAPSIAQKAAPGQFVILMTGELGERIPLTIADYDRNKGTVTIIFQTVGATTLKLSLLEVGDCLTAFVGPLGIATHLEGIKKAAVVGGGVGCAIAYPVAKELHALGCQTDSIIGFRSRELVILEREFAAVSHRLVSMSDDGSWGQKGRVTDALRQLIEGGADYDHIFAIGPLIMMKFVAKLTREYNLPTTVSMNPIMIDGTGMCGCCRLTVGGETRFACVDGPDFDGHLVDFDEAMERSTQYKAHEGEAHRHQCNLLAKGEEAHG